METINISIEVPLGLNLNLAAIKSKVTEYAKSLIKSQAASDADDMTDAMKYIKSLAVPGGEHAPIENDITTEEEEKEAFLYTSRVNASKMFAKYL